MLKMQAIVEDAHTLRTTDAVNAKKGQRVSIWVSDDEEIPLQPTFPPGYHDKSPAQRAEEFQVWCEHFVQEAPADRPPLSDWAVSRDSIYD